MCTAFRVNMEQEATARATMDHPQWHDVPALFCSSELSEVDFDLSSLKFRPPSKRERFKINRIEVMKSFSRLLFSQQSYFFVTKFKITEALPLTST